MGKATEIDSRSDGCEGSTRRTPCSATSSQSFLNILTYPRDMALDTAIKVLDIVSSVSQMVPVAGAYLQGACDVAAKICTIAKVRLLFIQRICL